MTTPNIKLTGSMPKYFKRNEKVENSKIRYLKYVFFFFECALFFFSIRLTWVFELTNAHLD